jgi:hypothetical protein
MCFRTRVTRWTTFSVRGRPRRSWPGCGGMGEFPCGSTLACSRRSRVKWLCNSSARVASRITRIGSTTSATVNHHHSESKVRRCRQAGRRVTSSMSVGTFDGAPNKPLQPTSRGQIEPRRFAFRERVWRSEQSRASAAAAAAVVAQLEDQPARAAPLAQELLPLSPRQLSVLSHRKPVLPDGAHALPKPLGFKPRDLTQSHAIANARSDLPPLGGRLASRRRLCECGCGRERERNRRDPCNMSPHLTTASFPSFRMVRPTGGVRGYSWTDRRLIRPSPSSASHRRAARTCRGRRRCLLRSA